jgi:hypothetical protein
VRLHHLASEADSAGRFALLPPLRPELHRRRRVSVAIEGERSASPRPLRLELRKGPAPLRLPVLAATGGGQFVWLRAAHRQMEELLRGLLLWGGLLLLQPWAVK